MYAIDYARRAELDILEIGLLLESERGAVFAVNYLRSMRERIESLSEMPRRTRERKELRHGHHALILSPYIVFYQVTDNTVVVKRVLHGSRKITKRMLNE